MSIQFEDNRVQVKAAIDNAISAFLHEAGGEIQARTVRNSRTDTSQTKGSASGQPMKKSVVPTVISDWK